MVAAWLGDDNGVLVRCCARAPGTNVEDCTPSGLTHPATYTAKFQQFMHDQMGSGPFRFCVDYRIFDPNH